MTPTRKRRLALVCFMLVGISSAVALALQAFERNLLFFFTPTQVSQGEVPKATLFRLGGVVTPGSVRRGDDGKLDVSFSVTDGSHAIDVVYDGLLPDLFREGKGIVVRGTLVAEGYIHADEVLAKHDENYLPPPAAAALEASINKNQ